MELIRDFIEESIYTFIANGESYDKTKAEEVLENGICDEEYINTQLNIRYPKKYYFVLVDYIDDKNNGYFHIRIWDKKIR